MPESEELGQLEGARRVVTYRAARLGRAWIEFAGSKSLDAPERIHRDERLKTMLVRQIRKRFRSAVPARQRSRHG